MLFFFGGGVVATAEMVVVVEDEERREREGGEIVFRKNGSEGLMGKLSFACKFPIKIIGFPFFSLFSPLFSASLFIKLNPTFYLIIEYNFISERDPLFFAVKLSSDMG